MTRLCFIPIQLTRYPHTHEALFAIALWPLLLAIGCWRTPQVAQCLNAQGVEISILQVDQCIPLRSLGTGSSRLLVEGLQR